MSRGREIVEAWESYGVIGALAYEKDELIAAIDAALAEERARGLEEMADEVDTTWDDDPDYRRGGISDALRARAARIREGR